VNVFQAQAEILKKSTTSQFVQSGENCTASQFVALATSDFTETIITHPSSIKSDVQVKTAPQASGAFVEFDFDILPSNHDCNSFIYRKYIVKY